MGADVGVGTTAVQLPKNGRFADVIVPGAVLGTLEMEDRNLAAVDTAVTGVDEAIAIIRIVVGHGEAILIESSFALWLENKKQMAYDVPPSRGLRANICFRIPLLNLENARVICAWRDAAVKGIRKAVSAVSLLG